MVRSKSIGRQPQMPTMPVPDKLWSSKELCAFLGIQDNYMAELIKKKGLPHWRVGRNYRFHPTAIARWVEEQMEII